MKVAPHVHGQVGTSEVEFTNFPYLACMCGEVARWAFDPGTDFSDQLFFGANGLPTARSSLGTVKCQRCGAELNARQEVSLEASAQLAKFAPITMRVRLLGYHCPACGLDQAPPDEFTAGNLPFSTHRSSDAGKALDAAVRSIGLSSP